MAISKITGAGLSSITAAELGTDSVDTDEIKAGAVTTVKIADSTGAADGVIAAKIASAAVTSVKLATAIGITDNYHKVPAYATDAARNTAIPSPTVGMLIYNTSAGALQQYNGTWAVITPAPNVASISGFLNDDTDSTLTIFGTNFNTVSAVKMFTAASGGSQIGSNATTTFNTNAKLTAVFGAGSIGASGSTAYIEVDNAGVKNRFATAITVNADPVIALSGNTGTGADTTDHLGTYGGVTAGGPADVNTVLLLNFDRVDLSTDFEDSSNRGERSVAQHTGGIGHSVVGVGAPHISVPSSGAPVTGKVNNSSAYFDGTGDYLTIPDSVDWDFGTGAFTIDFWVKPTVVPAGTVNLGGSIYSQVGTPPASAVRLSVGGMGGAGALGFYDGSTWHAAAAGTITVNVWQHIAIVRTNTSTDGLKFYKDGALVFTGTTSANITGGTTLEIGRAVLTDYFTGYLDSFRISKGIARWSTDFIPHTTVYGATTTALLPTITFTGATTPALAADEDIEFTSVVNSTKPATKQHLTDSGIGLVLTNLTASADKNKATLTGTIATGEGETQSNMAVKAQVRKTLATAAYADASRVVTFSGSETTAGLAPAMPVSGTGIPASTTITTVDTATTITLSANPTGGTLTGQSLVFEDLTRITHINGPDILDGTQAMMTIATAIGDNPVLFNARRYVGTGVAKALTGFGFQPDMVWFKNRQLGTNHFVYDSLRGATKSIHPADDTVEATTASGLTSFNSDGFSVGGVASHNQLTIAFLTWGFKAGGAPTANGKQKVDGTEANLVSTAKSSILSAYPSGAGLAQMYDSNFSNVQQSVNSVGKFSITRFEGGSSAEKMLPHGLGGIPDFIIIKQLSTAANWHVLHSGMSGFADSYLRLDENIAVTSDTNSFPITPTTHHVHTGLTVMNGNGVAGQSFIMYCWKAAAGVSHFGSYTGVANTNTHTITGVGFSPRFIMIKSLAASRSWVMTDIFSGFGVSGGSADVLYADKLDGDSAGTYGITPNSDGWTMATDHGEMDYSGTYIYCAFA